MITPGATRNGIDPSRTRAALRAIEPTFGAGVLCPAVHEALDRLGLGLAAVAYGPLGGDGMERMTELGAKVVRALGDAGLATTMRRPPTTA